MTRKIWGLVITGVLVSVILIEGQVFAAGKKIVVFLDGTSSQMQQATVAAVGPIVTLLVKSPRQRSGLR